MVNSVTNNWFKQTVIPLALHSRCLTMRYDIRK